jgi:hypothetical protein
MLQYACISGPAEIAQPYARPYTLGSRKCPLARKYESDIFARISVRLNEFIIVLRLLAALLTTEAGFRRGRAIHAAQSAVENFDY